MPNRRQLFKELWHLPRTHRHLDGNLAQCLTASRNPRQYGIFEPAKLLFPTRSRRASSDHDLGDDSLRSTWATELEQTRLGMLGLRQHLSDELRQRTNSDRFDFLATHRGMFSRLGVSAEAVETIRTDFGIYMIGDSRINIAGLNAQTVPILANALAQITK